MKAHSYFSNKHKLKDFPFDELKIQGILCNFYFVMCSQINKFHYVVHTNISVYEKTMMLT